MPLESSLVGTKIGPAPTEVDARWTMAYAAGLEDYLPCYLDTRRREGIVAHPVFPVCIEWPLAIALHEKMRASRLVQTEAARGVHATYDVTIHRLVRPPERLTTTLVLAGVQRLKPGAFELMRFDTAGQAGLHHLVRHDISRCRGQRRGSSGARCSGDDPRSGGENARRDPACDFDRCRARVHRMRAHLESRAHG